MRVLILIAFAAIAGCNSGPDGAGSGGNVAAPGQPIAGSGSTAPGMLGSEPATSENAQAARKIVQRYFALIDAHRYSDARLLWGNGGKDSGGTPAAFAAPFARYSIYSATVKAPTEIKASQDMQYILVPTDLHVKVRKGGAEADRTGAVMLRRSADPAEKSADKREWRIWGVDLRQHN